MAAVPPAAAAGREFSARFQAVFRDVEVRRDAHTPRTSVGANRGHAGRLCCLMGLSTGTRPPATTSLP